MTTTPGAVAIVLDVETTGFDPRTDRVVELAAVWVDATGRILRVTQSLVDPEIPIPARARAVHHLGDEDVRGAPKLRRALRAMEIGTDLPIAAHQAQFDISFLAGPEGDPRLAEAPRICTVRCARHLIPDAPAYGNQVLRYHLGLSVGTLSDPPHRAKPDAIVTAALLAHLLTLAPLARLIELTGVPPLLRTVEVGPREWRGRPWSEVDEGLLRWYLRPDKNFGDDVAHTARYWLEMRRRRP